MVSEDNLKRILGALSSWESRKELSDKLGLVRQEANSLLRFLIRSQQVDVRRVGYTYFYKARKG